MELKFWDRDDEGSVGFPGGQNCIAKAVTGHLQRTKAVDDDVIDPTLYRCFGPRSHEVQPLCIETAVAGSRQVILAAHLGDLPAIEHHHSSRRAIAQAIAELNQSA